MNSLSSEFIFPEVRTENKHDDVEFKIKSKEKLAEIFKIGTYINMFQDSSSKNFFRFCILKHLGFGSYGIVVLVEAEIVSDYQDFGKKNSIKVEVLDQHSKKLFQNYKNQAFNHENLFAIKIIDFEANDIFELKDPVSLAREEINLMSELQDCERILKYYVTFTSKSFLFILMEYSEGGSLYNLYNKYGSFPEELIASVIKDVVIALKRLHNQNKSECIIHNDIKSANILLSKCCVAKLADFGVSKKIHFSSNHNNSMIGEQDMLGSPFWMSPEAIIGSEINTSSDIWSLGITTLELAFGRIPWPTFKKLEDLLNHILKSPPPQKSIKENVYKLFSAEFWDFIDSCLQTNPKQRKTANVLLEHPFLKKSKTPNSIDDFIKIICGNQMNKATYIDIFLDYINGFFRLKPDHENNSQNIQKYRSISISRFFSRKKSSQVYKKSLNLSESTSLNTKKSDFTENNEESQLVKRISAKYIQKCLESSSSIGEEIKKLKKSDAEPVKINENKNLDLKVNDTKPVEKKENVKEKLKLEKESKLRTKIRKFENICSCFKVGKNLRETSTIN